jgi:diguanylate cyclase (GGDEF)-like protein
MLWRRIAGAMQIRAVVPIALMVAFAAVCVVLPVISSAYRADVAALHQQRQLFSQALRAKQQQVAREVEFIASSVDALAKLWIQLDEGWVHQQIGMRLKDQLEDTSVLLIDPRSGFVHALAGYVGPLPDLDGKITMDALSSLIARVEEKLRSEFVLASSGELAASNATPRRGVSDTLRFIGQPAIVAIAPLDNSSARNAAQAAPMLVFVSEISDSVLDRMATRFDLPRLRMLKASDDKRTDPLFEIADAGSLPVAAFAWDPHRPGARILSETLPFVILAIAGLVLLAALVLHRLRRAGETIAAGESQRQHLASHDSLSGVLNRMVFAQRLAAAVAQRHGRGPPAALVSIDLDHFRAVNETQGYDIGDALLQAVALRLRRVSGDGDIIARLGGDNFAVVVSGPTDQASLQAVGTRIIEALGAAYTVRGHTAVISASAGIVDLDEGKDSTSVMRLAEIALDRAKTEGRNRCCVYDSGMDATLTERKRLESDLRSALDGDALAVAYQPIVSPDGEKILGVEALCRWQHPVHGYISPLHFISIAEQSDLIIELGEWVLRRACRDACAWPDVSLAVNVSPLQFRRLDFPDTVQRILRQTGFDPRRLELELTESVLLCDVNQAQAAMQRLKGIGVKLALDDFGTGYSSLLYLRTFPFDRLKIDRSFVSSIETEDEAAAIVHAIVSLGRGLGMKVTAEGVETAEQQLFLRAAGVHSLQGYRFCSPVSAVEFGVRLTRQTPASPARRAAG